MGGRGQRRGQRDPDVKKPEVEGAARKEGGLRWERPQEREREGTQGR